METAGVAELKARLSDYLERVKAGEEVLVTEDGKVIARVVSVAQHEPRDAEIEELIQAGIIRPRKRERLPADFWTRDRAQDPRGGSFRRSWLIARKAGEILGRVVLGPAPD